MISIFISYGHGKYADLAGRVYDRLSKMKDENGELKYEVIKDSEGGIPFAERWDSALEDCISRADFIVYLMESHSVRRESVCLDEIAFARNKGGINIIPVRIEHIDTPLIVCRLQWIDWQKYDFDFETGITRICEAIENYEEKMLGQGSLFNHLFKADYNYTVDKIVGREEAIAEIEKYITGDLNRVFVISGVAGTGKSGLVSELSKNVGLVKAVHRCSFDYAHTLNPKDILCNLAYFLSCSNRKYADSVINEELDKIGEWPLKQTFENLFVKHLQDEKNNYALVIDGLDEMELSDALDLMNVLNGGSSKIDGVKIVVSVRSEKRFAKLIDGYPGMVLTPERNLPAAEKYVCEALNERKVYSDSLKDRLLEASDGNFLYLTYLFNEYDNGNFDINGENLPAGLVKLYFRSMMKRFPDPDRFRNDYYGLLSVLCAAAAPVTCEDLSDILGVGLQEIQKKIRGLSYIVKTEDKKVSVYHRSMKEFLCDSEASEDYCIDENDGHRMIAGDVSDIEEIEENAYRSEYLLYHIFKCKDAERFVKICETDMQFAQESAVKALIAMSADEYRSVIRVISKLEDAGEFIRKVSAFLLRDRLTETILSFVTPVKDKYPFAYHIVTGYCYEYTDRRKEAKEAYAEAYAVANRQYELLPSYGNRRDLLISYKKAADIAASNDDIEEAKRLYSLALEAAVQNAEQFPTYESRRELLLIYIRLSDIAIEKYDDIKAAKNFCSLALDIGKRNADSLPSYESKRDLALSYERLADIALKEDDIKEAKRLYSLALEIRKQNADRFPSYESKRGLSISYSRLADIALKEDDIKEAKRLYSHAHEIYVQTADRFPSYESKRGLSISYSRIANIALKEDDIKEAKRLYSLAHEIYVQNADRFPSYQSKRGLSLSYSRLADIALKEDDIKEAKRLYSLAHEIYVQNADRFPSYVSKRDLSVSYSNLADIALKEDDIKEAKRLYYLAHEIYVQNADRFPSYESKRDLSISYFKLADIAWREADMTEAKRLYSLVLDIDKQNAVLFPSNRSRVDVYIDYIRLAAVARREGNAEEATRYERLSNLAFEGIFDEDE